MKVPFVDLRAAHQPIQAAFRLGLDAILDDMQLLLGPNVQAFEREFADYCSTTHGVGISSGTDALFAALRACGVGPGDEVIAPAHTFFATIGAIIHTGATPVLVDVDAKSLTIDVDEVRATITRSTRVILPVHLYGQPADMDPIMALAQEYGLRVIEDCCQAHGARYKGRRCGGIGDAGCFSFYMTKNLGALGEGGFVATCDAGLAEAVCALRNHGHVSKFEHASVGYNLRLDEIQAHVLRLKLPDLDARNARRRALAERYATFFSPNNIQMPEAPPDCEQVHHIFPILVKDRDLLQNHLKQRGIDTGIHYKTPAHLQGALRQHPHRIGKMDVTETACARLLSLPIYPELTDEQIDHVARNVLQFLKRDSNGNSVV